MITMRDRFRGCLLGGAIGDALGAGIEFETLNQIRQAHGAAGVTTYVPAYGRACAITDDTQMTLFTAEGLLRADRMPGSHGGQVASVWRAYRRWLLTQVGHPRAAHLTARGPLEADGWLVCQEFLHHQRGPGRTCISAVMSGVAGSAERPANSSKGCGGVMRSAPAGLATLASGDSFSLGCDIAALTHGHPSGYLAAGALATIISGLARARSVPDAISAALGRLRDAEGDTEVAGALAAATTAAAAGPASAENVERLGEGWVAEEALAIAAYCALTAHDFRAGVLLAVNHGGDSDSTGSICGNLLGTLLGVAAIPGDLLDGLEGRQVITQIADDMHDVFADGKRPAAERYPAG